MCYNKQYNKELNRMAIISKSKHFREKTALNHDWECGRNILRGWNWLVVAFNGVKPLKWYQSNSICPSGILATSFWTCLTERAHAFIILSYQ